MNNLPTLKKPMAIVLALALLLSVGAPAMAQEHRAASGANVSPALSTQHGPADPAELGAFLDKLFAQDMEEYHIAGAAVAVV